MDGSFGSQISSAMRFVQESFSLVPPDILTFFFFAVCFISLMYLLGIFKR